MEQTDIIRRPVITEKSMDEAGRGHFTFAVLQAATKIDIKKAVEGEFKVHVLSVQTLIAKGKRRRAGKRRTEAEGKPFKKAIVKLKEGERIDLFEVQEEGKKKE